MLKTKTKTKIVATLGPATNTAEKVYQLIEAGLDVARINLSHGDRASHQQAIEAVKEARKRAGKPTAILLDNRGPEIRISELEEPISLTAGQDFTLTNNAASFSKERVGTNYPGIVGDVKEGERILLDDGKIILTVKKIAGDDILCTVHNSGILSSRKRVALPESIVNLPALSKADIADIQYGVAAGVDFIAASFIRKAEDVREVRRVIEEAGGNLAIISKIENQQGVDNVEEILEVSDGMMVARGDLGVELPAEQVPIIQKRIIAMANRAGKPVITATQMLESMIDSPTPTRAEASDVTNAILDGTDAVMLSAETAVGKYPVQAVEFLGKCAASAESAMDYKAILAEGLRRRRATIGDSISYACCATAQDLKAAAIITSTTSGSTARMVSRYRSKTPIIAVSTTQDELRHLQLVWGVTSLPGAKPATMDEQLDICVEAAQEAGLITNGDLVVITAGLPLGIVGTTNMIKVRAVADICFHGEGTVPGVQEGTVRVITADGDWQDMPEDAIVILSEMTNAAAEQLKESKEIRGIITEERAPAADAAALGREYSIPVVCNVVNATTLLKNGETITIDGSSGHISYGRISL